ncbi:MAG TPA: SDR family oxidoreductase [Planctomycetes bacterium]|nr:SDR family oxidoreductase [Planctomycetota bacterium]HIL36155.1 SDR family oxidoreductase [Planctomycetota bacterium]
MRKNEMALVTGASAGIGEDIARDLARRGFNLYLVARRGDRLQALADELTREHQIQALVHTQDLSTPGACDELLAALEEERVSVDVLVNNAGFGSFCPTMEADPERERAMVRILFQFPVDLTRALVPGMLERGHGQILQVASTASFQPSPGYGMYAASKAAILSWSNVLHFELRGTGVTCTTLCPGPTATEFGEISGHISNRLQDATKMSSEAVARTGVQAMLQGRATVIPGFANKLGALLSTRMPRWVVVPLVARVLRGSQ